MIGDLIKEQFVKSFKAIFYVLDNSFYLVKNSFKEL